MRSFSDSDSAAAVALKGRIWEHALTSTPWIGGGTTITVAKGPGPLSLNMTIVITGIIIIVIGHLSLNMTIVIISIIIIVIGHLCLNMASSQ